MIKWRWAMIILLAQITLYVISDFFWIYCCSYVCVFFSAHLQYWRFVWYIHEIIEYLVWNVFHLFIYCFYSKGIRSNAKFTWVKMSVPSVARQRQWRTDVMAAGEPRRGTRCLPACSRGSSEWARLTHNICFLVGEGHYGRGRAWCFKAVTSCFLLVFLYACLWHCE